MNTTPNKSSAGEAKATVPKYTVKQQTEFRSKNFGVYRNGELIEGGFFSRASADDVAQQYRDFWTRNP